MTNVSEYRPRLSVELTNEQANALRNLVPWGLKNQLFSVIVDDVIRLGKSHGEQFLAAILSRAIALEDWSSIKLRKESNDDVA